MRLMLTVKPSTLMEWSPDQLNPVEFMSWKIDGEIFKKRDFGMAEATEGVAVDAKQLKHSGKSDFRGRERDDPT